MPVGSRGRRAGRLRAWFIACAVAALPLFAAAPAVAADDPPCGLALNGRDITGATSPDRAVELDLSQGSVINLVAAAPTGTPVRVTAALGPISMELGTPFVARADRWRGTADLSDRRALGVGLYRIDVEAGPCSGSVWVAIKGRSPFATVLGITSVCLILIGLAGVVFSFVSSVRGRIRWLIAAASGAVLGLGANLLTQQLGTAPVSRDSLLLWTIIPGSVSAGVSALLRPRQGRQPDGAPRSAPGAPARPSGRPPSGRAPTSPPAPGPRPPQGPPPGPPTPSTPPKPPPAPSPAPEPPAYVDEGPHGPPATAGQPPPPLEPRFVQGRVLSLADSGHPAPVEDAIAPGIAHLVELEVGPLRAEPGWLRGPLFRDELPRDGRTHTVDVIVVEPRVLPEPVRGSIEVPPSGRSSPFAFKLTVPDGIDRLAARIMLLHRGRLLQTAVLEAPVRHTPSISDRITLELEAVLRTEFGQLGSRSDFGGALVFNHSADGSAAVTSVVDGQASYLTLTAGLLGVVRDLRADLETVTANSAAPRKLDAPETVELLRILARKGVLLREELTLGQGADEALLAQRRLQVLTVRAESFVPLEFVYDFAPPAMDATLCPDAADSLRSGHCDSCAARTDFPSPVVCPTGFWSVNRVIERQAARPAELRALGLDDHVDVALIAQRTERQRRLGVTNAGLFAFHDRVDALSDGASEGVLKALKKATGNHAVNAMTWRGWQDNVAAHLPGLLVLLPHTLTAQSEPVLEIAASEQLPRSFMSRALIGSGEPPIVFLLGCETALADVDFENFVVGFLRYGAAIVVGTVATVLGYQAAPVAAALVTEVGKASKAAKATSFGEVIRSARAELLADGHIMALSLTAYGDSDWEL